MAVLDDGGGLIGPAALAAAHVVWIDWFMIAALHGRGGGWSGSGPWPGSGTRSSCNLEQQGNKPPGLPEQTPGRDSGEGLLPGIWRCHFALGVPDKN